MSAYRRRPGPDAGDLSRSETIEILGNPETVRRLADSDAELARGEVVTEDEPAAAGTRTGSESPRARQTPEPPAGRPAEDS